MPRTSASDPLEPGLPVPAAGGDDLAGAADPAPSPSPPSGSAAVEGGEAAPPDAADEASPAEDVSSSPSTALRARRAARATLLGGIVPLCYTSSPSALFFA